MTPDAEPPGMHAVAHRHLSSHTICQYYRSSGTCRYRRCNNHHVNEAISTMYKHEQLPSVQERPWALSSWEESSGDGDAEGWRFSIASYNVLADKYAKHYRSYLYHDVPSGYLDWAHRRSAIVAELAHLQPDIICLQEVDRFDDLEDELQQLGYAGIFLQRSGARRDGCATFWRNALLRPALVRQLRYSEYDLKDNVALLVLFEPHTEATAAAQQQHLSSCIQQQQQVQSPMQSPRLLQQQLQEEQQQQRHKQDLLSQWLPRNWLHGSHHHLQQHKTLTRSGSLGSHHSNSSSSSIYQQPADVMPSPAWRSQSWGEGAGNSNNSSSKGRHHSRSSHRRRHSSRVESQTPIAAAAAADWDDVQQQQLQQQAEPVQLAPDWHRCGVLVANTHIIFTPDKGEVKLGQARMLVQEAADMARWYLQHHQPQPQQQQQQPQQQQQQQQQPTSCTVGSPNSTSTWSDNSSQTAMGNNARVHTASAAPSAATASELDGVVTIIAGDFNAIPNSPIYTFMAQGQVDLHRVNRRNVSHMTSGGSSLHKGYRGFRRTQKRRSVEEQRRSLEQQQWQQHSESGGLPGEQNSHSTAVEPGGAVAVPAGPKPLSARACGNLSSSPARTASLDGGSSYPNRSSSPQNGRLFKWSDKECRRAAGMSYDELLEASSTAAAASPAAPSDRPASPGTKIARAAAAFGARAAAGAGAAAASVAASAAAERGGPFEAFRREPLDGVGPLLLKHDLQLQSSYMSVLGREPEYTSSHSQFMDTCDYIWYTEAALDSSALQDQQQMEPSGQQWLRSNITGSRYDAAAKPGDDSSVNRAVEEPTGSGYALRPVAVLVPPDGMRLPKGLPSRWLGSDHVCLVADFQLTPHHQQ